MRICIVTGGAHVDLDWLKVSLKGHDLLIAVDRGLEAIEALGLSPDWILGDFDSYRGNLSLSNRYPKAKIMTFDAIKDWTDTELALGEAIAHCAVAGGSDSCIDVYGAFGSRMDHTLANLMLLAGHAQKSPRIRALDPHNVVERLYPGTYYVEKQEGAFVSLLPLDEEVLVTLEGFDYSGEALCMKRFGTLGVSNRLREPVGRVTLHSGRAFLMLCRDQDEKDPDV